MKWLFTYVFILFYRFFVFPLGLSLFWILTLGNKKIADGFKLRQGQPWLKSKLNGEVYWFHCSSGEIEYAKSVIRELKSQKPDVKILVTYFSPSVVSNLTKDKSIDFFAPLPWDTPLAIKEFLNAHKPKALMIARTDLWPELLWQAKKTKLPAYLFSATFKDESSFLQKLYLKIWIPLLTKVFVVSKEDQKNLDLIAKVPSEVIGDTRYDQCLYRLAQ